MDLQGRGPMEDKAEAQGPQQKELRGGQVCKREGVAFPEAFPQLLRATCELLQTEVQQTGTQGSRGGRGPSAQGLYSSCCDKNWKTHPSLFSIHLLTMVGKEAGRREGYLRVTAFLSKRN